MRRVLLALLAPLVFAPSAAAQDPFEIQVYEWETVPKGRWNLETHLNFVGNGTKHPGGDWKISESVVLNFGLGFALTNGSADLVGKLRLGVLF